jgi:hypothetical protein
MQSLVREEMFERHVRVGGGDGSLAASEIEISPEGHEKETDYHSGDEFHGLVLFLPRFYKSNFTIGTQISFDQHTISGNPATGFARFARRGNNHANCQRSERVSPALLLAGNVAGGASGLLG